MSCIKWFSNFLLTGWSVVLITSLFLMNSRLLSMSGISWIMFFFFIYIVDNALLLLVRSEFGRWWCVAILVCFVCEFGGKGNGVVWKKKMMEHGRNRWMTLKGEDFEVSFFFVIQNLSYVGNSTIIMYDGFRRFWRVYMNSSNLL